MVIQIDDRNISIAGAIHAASWKESHKAFCSPEFIARHTAQRQTEYLRGKIAEGSNVYMLVQDIPVGIVSIRDCLIEDLYVLPEQQHKGYGTQLLQFAINQCSGKPTLWILENNTAVLALYQKNGFSSTGNRKHVPNGIDEIELSL